MNGIRRSLATAVAALGIVLTLQPAAVAHHGWSGYAEKAEQLTGTIREVRYGNPHVTIKLASGDEVWEVVLAPPSRMERRGLPDGSLAVGQSVTVEGYRHREKRGEMRAEWITAGDKKQIPLR